jgi:transcriptional regulator with XRE-family HTH domain
MITNKQIKELRLALGRSKEHMALHIGVAPSTWASWERDTTPMKVFRVRLEKLYKFTFGKEVGE